MALIEKITNIADAIRSKTGTTDTMTLAQMPELINGIQTGGGGFPNGTEWTQSNVTKGSYVVLLYANGIWVAGNTLNDVQYSTDGMAWSKASLTYDTAKAYNRPLVLRYANGIWVMSFEDAGIYYSLDGMTWTQSNITSGYAYNIENANGIWVTSCTGFWYSLDGMTWTQSNITTGIGYENTVRNANGIWVANTINGGLYYSTDGMAWSQSNITSDRMYALTYNNGIWTASSHTADCLYYSLDGMTWTAITDAYGSYSTSAIDIIYANGTWVALQQGYLFYSTNGMEWTAVNSLQYCHGLYYANGIWVVGKEYGGFYYSTDGINWTLSNLTSGKGFTHMLNADGVWVSDLYNKQGVYYSTDGMSWTKIDSLPVSVITSISHANGIWVAASQNNGLYYSLTWAPTT